MWGDGAQHEGEAENTQIIWPCGRRDGRYLVRMIEEKR